MDGGDWSNVVSEQLLITLSNTIRIPWDFQLVFVKALIEAVDSAFLIFKQ